MRFDARYLTVPLFAMILGFGCGDDDNPTNTPKADPPAAVEDLAAVVFDDSTIALTWTTPDDPSKRMSVSAYDLRYSERAITEGNWANADTVHGEPVPGEGETADTFMVGGLDLRRTYHFALRSSDDKDDWSELSNVVNAGIPDSLAALEFALVDQNATSERHGEAVSPRDYLDQLSAWYFGAAT